MVLNFHRHNQRPSLPRSTSSQRRAFSRVGANSPVALSVHRASAVAQLPSESPRNAGQLPSRRCEAKRCAIPDRGACSASRPNARTASDVASMLLCGEPRKLHPPDRSCRFNKSSVRRLATLSMSAALWESASSSPRGVSCALSSKAPALINEPLDIIGVKPQGASARPHLYGWQVWLAFTGGVLYNP